MTYPQSLIKAARRTLDAADSLHNTTRESVAGYLYGIAAEIGVKQLMIESGMRDRSNRSGPFYAHFPHLKRQLEFSARGRLHAKLLKLSQDPTFMHHWDISMRYTCGSEIQSSWVNDWKHQARSVIAEIGNN